MFIMKRSDFLRNIFFLFLIFSFNCSGQDNEEKEIIREAVAAGSYYPADPNELTVQLKSFFNRAQNPDNYKNIAAVIVPHAGYVFSGETATSAYAQIDPDKKFECIFLIGTSHHVLLNGASVFYQGSYSTPLGNVEVDSPIAGKLITENSIFGYAEKAHNREHSLEVQLPYLQYHLKYPFKIVPIIIGTQSESDCSKIAKALKPYFTDQNLFVISSDFSHYPTYEGAIKADKLTGDAILTNSPDKFMDALEKNESEKIPGLITSCCGWSSILSLLYITSEMPDIQIEHVKYSNSGDSPYGDKQRVVGYNAFVVTRPGEIKEDSKYSLSTEDKKILLELARNTIDSYLKKSKIPEVNSKGFSENIKMPCGAFVTLNKNGRLRGCIGRFMATEPVYKVVQEMAIAAAFNDTRFSPVSLNEMKDIEIEISVLTPLQKITGIDEFKLGKHGIYIIKGNRSGTYLPQVARETGWNKDEFLGHCARDKAGIGYDGWKDADLYTYEALVFDESEISSH